MIKFLGTALRPLREQSPVECRRMGKTEASQSLAKASWTLAKTYWNLAEASGPQILAWPGRVWGQIDKQMDKQTGIPPVFYRISSPKGPLSKK